MIGVRDPPSRKGSFGRHCRPLDSEIVTGDTGENWILNGVHLDKSGSVVVKYDATCSAHPPERDEILAHERSGIEVLLQFASRVSL